MPSLQSPLSSRRTVLAETPPKPETSSRSRALPCSRRICTMRSRRREALTRGLTIRPVPLAFVWVCAREDDAWSEGRSWLTGDQTRISSWQDCFKTAKLTGATYPRGVATSASASRVWTAWEADSGSSRLAETTTAREASRSRLRSGSCSGNRSVRRYTAIPRRIACCNRSSAIGFFNRPHRTIESYTQRYGQTNSMAVSYGRIARKANGRTGAWPIPACLPR